MKKVLSVLLSVLLIFTLFTAAFAADGQDEYSEYPVILVPGYTSAVLYRTDGQTGEKITVWEDPVAQVGENSSLETVVPDFAAYLFAGDVAPLAKKLGEGFNRIFDGLKCNPDGTSYYDVKTVVSTAEECNYANLREAYPEGTHQYESAIMADLAEKVGYENLYVYTGDWRMGAIENAENLRSFIDDVIEYTNGQRAEKGKEPIDKVNIFAVSHGGQISGTYLTLYGSEGKVNNAVLTCPALGGAGIAYDAFNCDVAFDDVGLVTFIQHGFILEEDYQILVAAGQLGFLDELVEALIPYVMETIGCWGSLWDFIPLEQYEAVKEKCLDETVNAGLIAKSDRMHYEIMSPDGENYFAKGFAKAQQAGTNIYIMAGYDSQVVSGMEVSSDAILPTAASTGATVAPYGQRFADGYTQKLDNGFYQVSPSMTVDASTSYLPEHTWFIENYYHGMTAADEFTYSLFQKLLLTDESFDVHSFEEYPQFHATTNGAHSVFAAFNSSTEGYVSSEDTALVVKNLSAENDMLISAITVNGADIDFEFAPFTLKPGESKEVKISTEIPSVSLKNFEINVAYLIETYTPLGTRTFDFTIMNGEPVAYDESSPYTQADMAQKIDEVIDENVSGILTKFGVKGIVSNVFDIFYKLYAFIFSIVDYFTNLK